MKLGSLLGECQAKRHNQAKDGKKEGWERRNLLPATNKENTGDLSQSSASQNQDDFKLKGTCTCMKGLSRGQHRIGAKVNRVQALVDKSRGSEKVNIIISSVYHLISSISLSVQLLSHVRLFVPP